MPLWNPVQHVRDAWTGVSTRWGKASVILFFGYIWALIVANIVQLFNPMSQGWGCMAQHADAYSAAWFDADVRGWCLVIIFWALYVENAGLVLGNVLVFLLMICTSYLVSIFGSAPAIRASGAEDNGCVDSLLNQGWIYLTPIVLAFVALLQEKRAGPDDGTAEERTSLTV